MGLVEDAGMSVGSICPTFAADRDLSHPDGEVRENAARYVRGLADLAGAAGAPTVTIAPTAFRRDQPLASQEREDAHFRARDSRGRERVSILRHRERFSDRLRVQTLPGAAETLIGTEMVAIALLAGILNAPWPARCFGCGCQADVELLPRGRVARFSSAE